MIVNKLIEQLEVQALRRPELGDELRSLLMNTAQLLDAARMIREGLDLEDGRPVVKHHTSVQHGIQCWDQILGEG